MTKPTHEDAMLMVELMKVNAAMNLGEALNWLWSDAFEPDYAAAMEKYPPGTQEGRWIGEILGYFESLGTLYKNGLFSGELLFDWLAVHMVWDRIGGLALGFREAMGEPRIYEHLEAMAEDSRKAFA